MTSSSDEVQRQIRRIGEAGLVAMTRSPGLAAAVDQHAAAVRDVIEASGGTVRTVTLLDYLDGFVHAAFERGWRPGQGGEVSDDGFLGGADPFAESPSWQSLRVLAVYWMARHEQREADR